MHPLTTILLITIAGGCLSVALFVYGLWIDRSVRRAIDDPRTSPMLLHIAAKHRFGYLRRESLACAILSIGSFIIWALLSQVQ